MTKKIGSEMNPLPRVTPRTLFLFGIAWGLVLPLLTACQFLTSPSYSSLPPEQEAEVKTLESLGVDLQRPAFVFLYTDT